MIVNNELCTTSTGLAARRYHYITAELRSQKPSRVNHTVHPRGYSHSIMFYNRRLRFIPIIDRVFGIKCQIASRFRFASINTPDHLTIRRPAVAFGYADYGSAPTIAYSFSHTLHAAVYRQKSTSCTIRLVIAWDRPESHCEKQDAWPETRRNGDIQNIHHFVTHLNLLHRQYPPP